VLLAVLVVVVLMTLAAYQFGQMMSGEFQFALSATRSSQTRALAESGINYSAALLSSSDNITNLLNGNPYDNAQGFQNIAVPTTDSNGRQGYFSVVAAIDPDSAPNGVQQAFRYGVVDESGRININALFQLDSSGQIAHDILVQLPNMTEDIANSILDWIDPDDSPRPNGAESDYYNGLDPPYQCKNAPLDTLEELLLVKGVTPQLLYGNDRNGNGLLDPDEDGQGTGILDRGWAAYLTVHSRERNIDSTGNARIYVNDNNLSTLYTNLNNVLGADLANYIIAYRLYSQSTTTTPSTTPASPNSTPTQRPNNPTFRMQFRVPDVLICTIPATPTQTLTPFPTSTLTPTFPAQQPTPAPAKTTTSATPAAPSRTTATSTTPTGKTATSSMMMPTPAASSTPARNLNNNNNAPTTVTVAGKLTVDVLGNLNQPTSQPKSISSLYDLINSSVTVTTRQGNQTINTVYASPLNDSGQLPTLLPLLLDYVTTSRSKDIPARVNVNTAPSTVLATLPGMDDTTVQAILDNRPNTSSTDAPDPIYQTPAWLITQAKLSPTQMKTLERYITTTTQVYRVQVLGYFDPNGPATRLEAVIDTNAGRPRIIYYRDRTELGKGFQVQQNQ
jgi:type II secretory pathway component PulK